MRLLERCPNCWQQEMWEADYHAGEAHCNACGYTSDNLLRDGYTLKFRSVLQEVLALARGPKTSDYGEAWQETGLRGIYIKIMIKHARLRSLVWQSHKPTLVDETVRDTLLDLAAYATYGVMCLDDKNDMGASEAKTLRDTARQLERVAGELEDNE